METQQLGARDPLRWRERIRGELQLPERPEEVPLEAARGRVLAEGLSAPEDLPAVPVSAMDGFAVRSADLRGEGEVSLQVVGDLPARSRGLEQGRRLREGTALRIMTGAPVPDGADMVVPVEQTDASATGAAPEQVVIAAEAQVLPGRHVRGVGEEVARGMPLAEPGDRVGAGLIALAQSLGVRRLVVRAAARVSVVVTGDELVDASEGQGEGAVRESNGAMLRAALEDRGAEVRVLRCGDDARRLREVLREAGEGADLVVTTGGVGHGAYDVVKELLGEQGAGSSHFEHLALRPGGPQGYGRLEDGTAAVHLPGTPVGALIGFHLFVRPLLERGDAAEPVRCTVLEREGDAGRGASRPGIVVSPGRRGIDAQGRPVVRVLPVRRLAPYGRADALVLGGAGEGLVLSI